MLEDLHAEAQQVLDELWDEKLIPFKFTVEKFTEGVGEYTIHFYDSRIYRVHVSLTEGHSFRDMVRSAVLARVEKLSGPLSKAANGRQPG